MNQTHNRLFLSLRQQFHFCLKSNSPISRFSPFAYPNPNPNSRFCSSSTSYIPRDQHTRLLRSRFLFSSNSLPLISLSSFRTSFNGVRNRNFATRLAESNNRPPKETILLEGCDFEHWLVVVDNPDPNLTRDEIIDGYVKTLAPIVGSENDARMKIYSVSTRHYFAFGALVSEELAYKLKELPHVRWVLPDSYLDVKNKTYAGEPFINGQVVPYDPKYHEIWVRNHEQSLKNNMKNKRKQREPNSSRLRQRSPPSSVPSSPNESWMSASGPQNQTSRPSTTQEHTLSSSSNTAVPSQNRMQSPQQAQSPDQMLKHTPPLSFQSQAPHSTQMKNDTMSTLPPPQSCRQRMGNQHQNWTSVTGSQNQAWYPSQMQQQASPPSVTPKPYTHEWSCQNQSPEPGSRYGSHLAEPPISNNGHSYNNFSPSSSGSNLPSYMVNSDFQGGGTPAQAQQNNHHRNIPHHVHNSVLQGGCPPKPLSHQPYQYNYRDMQSSNAMVSLQDDWNCQKENMTPSAPAWDMPPQNANPGFQGRDKTYAHRQNGFSYRGLSGEVQNGNSHNGYLSTVPQHQQCQNSYVDLQSSNAMVPPQGALNNQNANMTPPAPPRDMPSQMQKPDIQIHGIRSPAQLNGDAHSGCYPSHSSPGQQHPNTSRDFQSSNAMGSPQIGNYQKMAAPMQNSRFLNANMIPHHVQNQFRGTDMPQTMQNVEYQHDMRQAAKQKDDCSGGALPGSTGRETVQTRDYQERDVPSDDEYVFASK